jgi:hypothetical protein
MINDINDITCIEDLMNLTDEEWDEFYDLIFNEVSEALAELEQPQPWWMNTQPKETT